MRERRIKAHCALEVGASGSAVSGGPLGIGERDENTGVFRRALMRKAQRMACRAVHAERGHHDTLLIAPPGRVLDRDGWSR